MRRWARSGIRLLFAAVAATVLAASPAAATLAATQCVLEPGVYGVVDAQGQVVGLLIVYPDCRMEVWKPSNVI